MAASPVTRRPGDAALALVRGVRRRWRAARLIEAAGTGAAAGAVSGIAAAVLASNQTFLFAAIGFVAGSVLSLRVPLPTLQASADRLDQQAPAPELFGTIARFDDLRNGGRAWVAAQADRFAGQTRAGDVGVWSLGRAGWLWRVLILTVAAGFGVVHWTDGGDATPAAVAGHVRAGALLGAAPSNNGQAIASPPATRSRRDAGGAGRSRQDAAERSPSAQRAAADVSASDGDAASASAFAGPASNGSTTPFAAALGKRDATTLRDTPAIASDSPRSGDGDAAVNLSDAPGEADGSHVSTAGVGEATALPPASPATAVAPPGVPAPGTVSPPYRDLTRAYFAREGAG